MQRVRGGAVMQNQKRVDCATLDGSVVLLVRIMGVEDAAPRESVGVEACRRLIRESLEPLDEIGDGEHPCSFKFFRPHLSRGTLRRVGIKPTDSVAEMMVWWTHVRLYASAAKSKTRAGEFRDSAVSLADALADYLSEIYWAARDCTEPSQFVEIDRLVHSSALEPWDQVM